MKTIFAADLFCGAGGTTEGLMQAAGLRNFTVDMTAVNHWEPAIETHSQNHPDARHMCQSIDSISPRKAVPSGKLDILVASPECTHHSNARGGRPMNDQSRATAWNVLNWLDALEVRSLLLENVPEFVDWGPLYPDDYGDEALRGRPVPSEKGKFFKNFVRNLRCLGYAADWKVLNCADYGDATTRRRLFMRADKGVRRVKFPVPTHYPTGGLDLTGDTWIPARDIIDWTNPGKSIFSRKHPLAEATLRRIDAGLQKFCGLPFTIGQQSCASPRSVANPLSTVATAGAISLCTPFITPFYGEREGQPPRCLSVDEPLDTVTTAPRFALAQPFLVGAGGPCGSGKPQSVDGPLGTVLTENHRALVQPFLISYYGNSRGAQSVTDPLDTVTVSDRFGLCQPVIRGDDGQCYRLDVLFRMLQPAELAAAHSFPARYRFSGNRKDVVAQIGNSVPVSTARSLCGSVIDRWAA